MRARPAGRLKWRAFFRHRPVGGTSTSSVSPPRAHVVEAAPCAGVGPVSNLAHLPVFHLRRPSCPRSAPGEAAVHAPAGGSGTEAAGTDARPACNRTGNARVGDTAPTAAPTKGAAAPWRAISLSSLPPARTPSPFGLLAELRPPYLRGLHSNAGAMFRRRQTTLLLGEVPTGPTPGEIVRRLDGRNNLAIGWHGLAISTMVRRGRGW
jgi:hypothetical protein